MKLAGLIPISILAAACAHTTPSELVDARAEYDRARNGLAAQLAPADLHVAATQLAAAEQAYRDRGDDYRTRDLAYAAERKARLAEVHAHTRAALQQQADARAELDQVREEKVRTTSAQLNVAQQQLATAEQQRAAAEHQAMTAEQQRADAEKRAQQAQADLSRIASVKQEPRGMVITLSGSVLFASGKYDLLPQAMAKLSDVATVLTRQDPDSKITVQGYTDSQGSVDFNMELSRQRAEAVRSYLVSHGIAPDRISAEGFGPARPIASNGSPEGRADNRRVEIVVEKK